MLVFLILVGVFNTSQFFYEDIFVKIFKRLHLLIIAFVLMFFGFSFYSLHLTIIIF